MWKASASQNLLRSDSQALCVCMEAKSDEVSWWQAGGDGAGAQLRPLAVSLLCGMAHSTQRTRAELWAQNGLDLLLNLLKQQVRTPPSPLP